MLGPARSRERDHLTNPADTRGARAADDAGQLDRMIADAIAVNERAKAADDKDKATGDRLDRLEAAAAERPPIERSPLHKLMRWGEPAT